MLKQHRMAKGLTLRELGQRMNVSTAAVGFWETGRYSPSARMIPKLAKALDLTPFQVLELFGATRKGAA